MAVDYPCPITHPRAQNPDPCTDTLRAAARVELLSQKPDNSRMAALTLGALGVVYGDIGTSPLYALREVFASKHAALTLPDILGVLSLVFWTLTVIVSLKYVALILRANNNGEGGTMALMAL